MNLPTLSTERLILRPLQEHDAEAIFDYAQDPLVSQYTLWDAHKTLDDSLRFIKEYAFGNYDRGEPEPFGIVLKSQPQKVIGTVGCFWGSVTHRYMELGYALSQDYWNQGIMTEAASEMIKFVFSKYDISRIEAQFKKENEASGKVMQKVGMTFEGKLRQKIFNKGRYWDMVYYSILRKEFEATQRPPWVCK